MDGITRSIAGRMAIAVFLVHLIVLPILYAALYFVVRQSNEDQFLNYVRGYTRFVADSLERVDETHSDQHITEILDGFMLSGTGAFADIQADGRSWHSSLNIDRKPRPPFDDFTFGEHDDDVYYTSVPVELNASQAVLRLGFDEQPVVQQNQLAYTRSAIILLTYLLVVVLLTTLIGRRVTRPIRSLQEASRRVASGHTSDRLTVESDLIEFVELSNDLDLMMNKLTDANQQLQREVRDRIKAEEDRAALESQLRHKQRIETVGTLAGGIAHELNNILVPILLYTEMAIEDLPTDSLVRPDLERVMKSANRAKAIVSQVLTFSRQIGGSELEQIDLSEVVAESVDLLRPAMPPNILLSMDMRVDEALVRGEQSLLGQMVVNLLTNAYQSMIPGGGDLGVHLGKFESEQPIDSFNSELPPGTYFRLIVSDTGDGIDETTMDHIFEPFYSTRGVGEGTGLGLSVVHGIVSSLDGGIVVVSKSNAGSSFTVYLPVIDNS